MEVGSDELRQRIEVTVMSKQGRSRRKLAQTAVGMAVLAGPFMIHLMVPRIWAQTAASVLAFDVASVKPSNSSTGYIRTEPGRLTARGRTLASLILRAYSLKDYQLTHEPSISLAERCDIDAKADGPANAEQLYRMLQTLLAERFKMVLHRETKELPLLVLSLGRNPPKLQKPRDGETQVLRYEPGQAADRPTVRLIGRRVSLSFLTGFLGAQLRTAVLDETGLEGEFDFTAEFTPTTMPANGDAPSLGLKDSAIDSSSVIGAIRADLGLKLESEKRPIDVLVVDHVEKLAAN